MLQKKEICYNIISASLFARVWTVKVCYVHWPVWLRGFVSIWYNINIYIWWSIIDTSKSLHITHVWTTRMESTTPQCVMKNSRYGWEASWIYGVWIYTNSWFAYPIRLYTIKSSLLSLHLNEAVAFSYPRLGFVILEFGVLSFFVELEQKISIW